MRERKKESVLYVLRKETGCEHLNMIFAISEIPDEIAAYYCQFKDYFDQFDCAVDEVVHTGKIKYLLDKYDSHLLEWLTDDIVVTRWEYEFYVKELQEAYKETKSMMSQMLLFNRMSSLSIEEKNQLQKTFDMLYGHIKCYNDFVSTLDSTEIMKKYIVDPKTCLEMKLLNVRYQCVKGV